MELNMTKNIYGMIKLPLTGRLFDVLHQTQGVALS